MKTVFQPVRVENNHPVTKETDPDFVFLMQRSALMALKEAGLLNEMQHRYAEQRLLRMHRGID